MTADVEISTPTPIEPNWTELEKEFLKSTGNQNIPFNINPVDPVDPFENNSEEIKPYQVSSLGITKLAQLGKGDKKVEIQQTLCSTPFKITKTGQSLRVNSNDDSDCIVKYEIMYKTRSQDIRRRYVNPTDLLTHEIKKLSNYGLVINGNHTKDLIDYCDKLLSTDTTIEKEAIVNKNGWFEDDSILVTGKYKHTETGMSGIMQLSDFLQPGYDIKGEKIVWIKNVSPLFDYDLFRFKIYGMISAFIIKYFSVDTFIIHNYYESGAFKSGTVSACVSMIGNPTELKHDANNSNVGVEKILEYNTNTPVIFEETSNNQNFKDLIYLIRNGKGKGRGTKDLGYIQGGNWKTVVLTSGEYPLTKDSNTKTGQQMGVLELHDGIPNLGTSVAKGIEETVKENYGLFLEEIVQKIIKEKPNLKTYQTEINAMFDESPSIFTERLRAYFVLLAVSGKLVEDILEDNGIQRKDHVSVCKKYYKKIVLDDPTVPYSTRALHWLYEWTIQNKNNFIYDKKFGYDHNVISSKETLGYIKQESITYPERSLDKAMTLEGWTYSRVKEDWYQNNILIPRTKKDPKTKKEEIVGKINTVNINNMQVTGINISFDTFRRVLGFDGSMLGNEIVTSPTPEEELDEISSLNLKSKIEDMFRRIPKLKNATSTVEEAVNNMKMENPNILEILTEEKLKKFIYKCKGSITA